MLIQEDEAISGNKRGSVTPIQGRDSPSSDISTKSPLRTLSNSRSFSRESLKKPLSSVPGRLKSTPKRSTSFPSLNKSPVVDMSESRTNLENCLDLGLLQQIYAEFKARYPERFETHLQALSDKIDDMMLESGIMLKPFGSRSFKLSEEWLEGVYRQLPKIFREWLEAVIENFTSEDLESFVKNNLNNLISSQKSNGASVMIQGSVGQQVMIQAIMRNERARINVSRILSKVLKNYAHYQANPAIGHTIFWFLSQWKPHPKDLDLWFHFLLPCFGEQATSSANSFQSLTIAFIERWADQVTLISTAIVKPVEIDYKSFESLMLIAFSSSSVLFGNKRGLDFIPRLQNVYRFLKSKLTHRRSLVILSAHSALPGFISLIGSKDDILSKEASDLALKCLLRSSKGFRIWSDVYNSNISQSWQLLKVIKASFRKHQKSLDKAELLAFLSSVQAKNKHWLSKYKNSPPQKQNVSKRNLKLISADCQEIESFCKGSFFNFLWNFVLFFSIISISLFWLRDVPVFAEGISKARVVFENQFELGMERLSVVQNSTRAFIAEKTEQLIQDYPQLEWVKISMIWLHDIIKETYVICKPIIIEFYSLLIKSLSDLNTSISEYWLPKLGLLLDELWDQIQQIYSFANQHIQLYLEKRKKDEL